MSWVLSRSHPVKVSSVGIFRHRLRRNRSAAYLPIQLFTSCLILLMTLPTLAQDSPLQLPGGEWSTSRPINGSDVLEVNLPASESWRRVEVFVVHGAVEIPMTASVVDGSAASVRFTDEVLLGPDPGRIPPGEILVRIIEEGKPVQQFRRRGTIHPRPWYPGGATSGDVLERAARKLLEGKTRHAVIDLQKLQEDELEPALASEWMRLNASVQRSYSDVAAIHLRTSRQLLEEASERAPRGTPVRERVLIDQATHAIRNAAYTNDRELWRDELTTALERARTALSSARQRGDRNNAAAALVTIASVASRRGWVEETRSSCRSALDLVGDQETRWQCAVALARVWLVTGSLDVAQKEALKALRIVEEIRNERQDDASALTRRRQVYYLLADIESRRGDALAALLVAEQVRVRAADEPAPDRHRLQQVARKANGLATVVVALDAGDVLLVWTTYQGEWKMRRIEQQPAQAIGMGRQLHRSRGTDEEAALWLSQRILDGEELALTDRLLLAPIGALRRIPWGLLTIDGTALVDRCSWSLLPGVLAAQRALAPLPREGWWTVVNPQVEGLQPLPGSLAEGQRISRTLPEATLISGASATEKAVQRAANSARVLHIATHGDFNPYDPASSILKLSTEDGADGDLTARELGEFDLQSCRLLALTGCETAIGGATGADDLAGFPRAALKAGCQAILGTLWPVEDASAGRLVASLVDATDGEKRPAEVLRDACRARRGDPRDRHPSAWGGWVLVENGW